MAAASNANRQIVSGPVKSLLAFCDKQIYDDGMDRLKLMFYPLLPWGDLEVIDTPSKIYRKLLDKCSTEDEALKIFLFAVRAIGGSVRGKYCADEAKKIIGRDIPDLEFAKQSKQFRFFFWLLKIERRLPAECREHMMFHFGRLLEMNHRQFKGSLSLLFIRSYQKTKISEDGFEVLKQALSACKEHVREGSPEFDSLNKCISYLTKFENDDEKELFTSDDENSNASSMIESGPEREKLNLESRKRKKMKVAGKKKGFAPSFPINAEDSETADPKETETSGEVINSTIQEEDEKEVVLSTPAESRELEETVFFVPKSHSSSLCSRVSLTAAPRGGRKSRRKIGSLNDAETDHGERNHKETEQLPGSGQSVTTSFWQSRAGLKIKENKDKIFVFIVAVVIVAVVGVPICHTFVWSPLQRLPTDTSLQHREGNQPIIAEFDSFLVKQFYLQQCVASDSDDSLHKIYVYLEKQSCSSLPSTTTVHEYDEISPPPTIPVYMLRDSLISLHTSASTNGSENNPVLFYVIRTVEGYFDFINSGYTTSTDKRWRIHVGKHGNKTHTNISLTITEDDYYSIQFSRGVSGSVDLTYNLTVEIQHIDMQALNTTPVGTLDPTSEVNKISKSFGFGTGKYCLFGDIHESTDTSTHNFTSLETHVGRRVGPGVGITVSALLLCFIVALVIGFLLYFGVKRLLYFCSHRQKGYDTV